MMDEKRKIYVYAHWKGVDEPSHMGTLFSERLRGKEVFSFEYNPRWLNKNHSLALDPDLQLYQGIQYLQKNEKSNFGIFLDSSPDRWGRVLMQRKEALKAKIENRSVNKLFETDYLLGVYDKLRLGGLRFSLEDGGTFLNDDNTMAAPPWTSLRELEEISMKIDSGEQIGDNEHLRWINMLIAPGSSLGGARPKATVQGKEGDFWLAKFPSKNDTTNIGAWEMVSCKIANECQINMTKSFAQKFSSNHHTFLTLRFDRDREGNRIHFQSAMTMLGQSDGHGSREGVSYLKIAEFIQKHSNNVKSDLQQLFKRIVFSVLISNTDDHLRNHGFLLIDGGWRLSPAYDINPNHEGNGLSLNIDQYSNDLDIGLVLDTSEFYYLEKSDAEKIVQNINNSVSKWKTIAKSLGLGKNEIEMKSPAFSAVQIAKKHFIKNPKPKNKGLSL